MDTQKTTQKNLKSQLSSTILPNELTNIILKYTKPSIKTEFLDSTGDKLILIYNQYEFSTLNCEDIINIVIYGVLVLVNPIKKFKESKIQIITGSVIIIGNVSEMFHGASDFNPDTKKEF
jgi:hypothetical protein